MLWQFVNIDVNIVQNLNFGNAFWRKGKTFSAFCLIICKLNEKRKIKIQNICSSIKAVFFKLGTRNVYHTRKKDNTRRAIFMTTVLLLVLC